MKKSSWKEKEKEKKSERSRWPKPSSSMQWPPLPPDLSNSAPLSAASLPYTRPSATPSPLDYRSESRRRAVVDTGDPIVTESARNEDDSVAMVPLPAVDLSQPPPSVDLSQPPPSLQVAATVATAAPEVASFSGSWLADPVVYPGTSRGQVSSESYPTWNRYNTDYYGGQMEYNAKWWREQNMSWQHDREGKADWTHPRGHNGRSSTQRNHGSRNGSPEDAYHWKRDICYNRPRRTPEASGTERWNCSAWESLHDGFSRRDQTQPWVRDDLGHFPGTTFFDEHQDDSMMQQRDSSSKGNLRTDFRYSLAPDRSRSQIVDRLYRNSPWNDNSAVSMIARKQRSNGGTLQPGPSDASFHFGSKYRSHFLSSPNTSLSSRHFSQVRKDHTNQSPAIPDADTAKKRALAAAANKLKKSFLASKKKKTTDSQSSDETVQDLSMRHSPSLSLAYVQDVRGSDNWSNNVENGATAGFNGRRQRLDKRNENPLVYEADRSHTWMYFDTVIPVSRSTQLTRKSSERRRHASESSTSVGTLAHKSPQKTLHPNPGRVRSSSLSVVEVGCADGELDRPSKRVAEVQLHLLPRLKNLLMREMFSMDKKSLQGLISNPHSRKAQIMMTHLVSEHRAELSHRLSKMRAKVTDTRSEEELQILDSLEQNQLTSLPQEVVQQVQEILAMEISGGEGCWEESSVSLREILSSHERDADHECLILTPPPRRTVTSIIIHDSDSEMDLSKDEISEVRQDVRHTLPTNISASMSLPHRLESQDTLDGASSDGNSLDNSLLCLRRSHDVQVKEEQISPISAECVYCHQPPESPHTLDCNYHYTLTPTMAPLRSAMQVPSEPILRRQVMSVASPHQLLFQRAIKQEKLDESFVRFEHVKRPSSEERPKHPAPPDTPGQPSPLSITPSAPPRPLIFPSPPSRQFLEPPRPPPPPPPQFSPRIKLERRTPLQYMCCCMLNECERSSVHSDIMQHPTVTPLLPHSGAGTPSQGNNSRPPPFKMEPPPSPCAHHGLPAGIFHQTQRYPDDQCQVPSSDLSLQGNIGTGSSIAAMRERVIAMEVRPGAPVPRVHHFPPIFHLPRLSTPPMPIRFVDQATSTHDLPFVLRQNMASGSSSRSVPPPLPTTDPIQRRMRDARIHRIRKPVAKGHVAMLSSMANSMNNVALASSQSDALQHMQLAEEQEGEILRHMDALDEEMQRIISERRQISEELLRLQSEKLQHLRCMAQLGRPSVTGNSTTLSGGGIPCISTISLQVESAAHPSSNSNAVQSTTIESQWAVSSSQEHRVRVRHLSQCLSTSSSNESSSNESPGTDRAPRCTSTCHSPAKGPRHLHEMGRLGETLSELTDSICHLHQLSSDVESENSDEETKPILLPPCTDDASNTMADLTIVEIASTSHVEDNALDTEEQTEQKTLILSSPVELKLEPEQVRIGSSHTKEVVDISSAMLSPKHRPNTRAHGVRGTPIRSSQRTRKDASLSLDSPPNQCILLSPSVEQIKMRNLSGEHSYSVMSRNLRIASKVDATTHQCSIQPLATPKVDMPADVSPSHSIEIVEAVTIDTKLNVIEDIEKGVKRKKKTKSIWRGGKRKRNGRKCSSTEVGIL